MEHQTPPPEPARWCSLPAMASHKTLGEAALHYGRLSAYAWLRRPEIGLAAVPAGLGGTGARFNPGEMPVTRRAPAKRLFAIPPAQAAIPGCVA